MYSLLFIDDSIGQENEEEGVFYGAEEEEENFNHLTNQGKLALATLLASWILANNPSPIDLLDLLVNTKSQFYSQA